MSPFAQRQVAKAFGVVLRNLRRDAGISQEELAEVADIDRTYPSLLERGLRQPTIGKVIAIAGALGIDATTLVSLTVARLRKEGTP
jgi:transcriptional regulator with XRE-family HTH domain